jgi:hypothetical protein
VEKGAKNCGFQVKCLCKSLRISCGEAAETRRITDVKAVDVLG